MVLVSVNYCWPEKTPQLTTSVLNAVCCHIAMSRQYFIFSLLLTFDEHVKCNDSDQEMTKLVSKPCHDTNGDNKTDDTLWCNGQSDCFHNCNMTCFLRNQQQILMKFPRAKPLKEHGFHWLLSAIRELQQ